MARIGNVPLPEPYLIALGVGLTLSRLRPWPLPVSSSLRRLIGVPLAAAGTLLAGAAVRSAGQVEVANPQQLLTRGSYARTRNPMYVGWALIHLGAGVAMGSSWLLVSFLPAIAWIHGDVLREEQALHRRFGSEFEVYAESVPRYLFRVMPTAPGLAERDRRS
ncbi:MAG TPA: isoprenylcysteine carboxylmethyltransferase family protein [Acidothermales bacterium]